MESVVDLLQNEPNIARISLCNRRTVIVERWYQAIAALTSAPLEAMAVQRHLGALVDTTIALLLAEPFEDARGQEIGTTLARLHCLHPDALWQTLIVLGDSLSDGLPAPYAAALQPHIIALLGSVGAGYLAQATNTIVAEQEVSRAALLTEQEQTTSALQESETRFGAIFAGSAIGITLADLEGKAVHCNPAVERILGYREEELQHLTFTDFTPDDDIGADRELFDELVAGKRRSYQKEKRYYHKHGEIVWCNLTASLLHDAAGAPQFALGMIEDITERKRPNPTAVAVRQRITEREMHVLTLLSQGLTQEQIADTEHLSPRTVGRMVALLQEKLDVSSSFALGMRAAQLGLIK